MVSVITWLAIIPMNYQNDSGFFFLVQIKVFGI